MQRVFIAFLTVVYGATGLTLAVVGPAIEPLTGGFVAHEALNGSIRFCRDEVSNAPEANVMLAAFVLLAWPALMRLGRIWTPISAVEAVVFVGTSLILVLLLATNTCGTLADSARVIPIFAAMPVLWVTFTIAGIGLILSRLPRGDAE